MNKDISGLPDAIIGEILSLIPTKQAVVTSILSKRWQYLWTSIKNLDFVCMKGNVHKEDHTTFVNFTDRVLSNCTTRELRRFDLRTYCCKSHVPRWVNEAIDRNVKMLFLEVPQVPGNIFTCRSLTSLEPFVFLSSVLNIPDSIYLPKLKVLHIYFPKELTGFAQKLVFGCQALEDFSVIAATGFQETFVISLPLVKRLNISTTQSDSGENGYTLVIDAPQLQFLRINGNNTHMPSYVLKNLASEVEAIINVGARKSETRGVVELLNQLIEVKSLTIDPLTIRGLADADLMMLPIFDKLTLLKVNMDVFYGWEILFGLLQACPRIEVLIVKMDSYCADEDPEVHWIEPQHVPTCLTTCLRVVHISCICRREIKQEIEMMKYLLGNGEVLQKLVAQAWNVSEAEIRENLMSFPRASRYCEVQALGAS